MAIDPAQVESVFAESVGQADAAARAAYLDQACGGDAEFRSRVDALLAAHDESASFRTRTFTIGTDGSPLVPFSSHLAKSKKIQGAVFLFVRILTARAAACGA